MTADGRLGLSEYVSRPFRLKIVETCIGSIQRDLEEKWDRGATHIDKRTSASSVLAGLLGVSKRTVNRWLEGGVQSCNINLEELLKISMKYAYKETLELLEEDLEMHIAEFKAFKEKAEQSPTSMRPRSSWILKLLEEPSRTFTSFVSSLEGPNILFPGIDIFQTLIFRVEGVKSLCF